VPGVATAQFSRVSLDLAKASDEVTLGPIPLPNTQITRARMEGKAVAMATAASSALGNRQLVGPHRKQTIPCGCQLAPVELNSIKLWGEDPITYFTLIRYGPHRELHLRKIRSCGNIFTDSLPSNASGICRDIHRPSFEKTW
jgi:hypothetical protein